MIALMNFTPTHCPNCGKEKEWDTYDRQDFFAGASQQCGCGLHYAYLDGRKLLAATDGNGDMTRYVDEAQAES